MFKINMLKKAQRPIKTIEQEMQETRARYQHYLNTTTNNYMAKRGDVTIKDPHTMPEGAYKELRDSIDVISLSAKAANKEVTFEDASVLTSGTNSAGSFGEYLSGKILITVRDLKNKLSPNPKMTIIDKSCNPEIPFMKKVSNALGEMFTGKKGANIDSELGLIK